MHVSELDYAVLSFLGEHPGEITVSDLAARIGRDQSQVAAACTLREADGLLSVREEESKVMRLGKKGAALAESGFPERKIIAALEALGGSGEFAAVASQGGIEAQEVGQSLRFLKAKGWAEQSGKSLTLTAAGRAALGGSSADEELLKSLADGSERVVTAEDAEGLKLLAGRGAVDERVRVARHVQLTDSGRAAVAQGLQTVQQVNVLTSEMLQSGEWKNVEFRPYDVTLGSEPTYPGKIHPFASIIAETRQVFLELGFDETVSPFVESSFWDFDALFQPQDHPARDMQDTFYVSRPEKAGLPRAEWVQAVGDTHRNGGTTGSLGWRYDWNQEMISQPVLRTHTTASSIRALAANPNPPRKVFCVGPVFRRETVDYKHLPVFHQVDGIIIDEKASFAALLGTLEAFYRKMGFKKFQFRPAFFPYTEPSVEIFVWAERKQDWVEMGGAGVFRPEVTRPFGCTTPVLAWGLGLERLAMFRYELGSIGELYRARLNWLKETPLCRS